MIAIAQHMLHLLPHQACADGQSAAQSLGGRHDVGMDLEIHVAVQLAGTAVAGLDFVNDEGDVLFMAQLVSGLQEFLVQRQHAALALDGLHHDAGHLIFLDALFQCLDIVGRHMDKAGSQGLEQLMEMILSGSRQGGQGTAMEAVYQRHDGITVRPLLLGGILSCHLDGAFVGFRAGVGEEDLLHAGLLAQQLCQFRAGLGIVQVGGVLHLAQLFGDSRHPGLVTEAESGDADAAAHIHIRLAVYIHHPAALTGDDLHREPLVGARNVSLVYIHNIHINHLTP